LLRPSLVLLLGIILLPCLSDARSAPSADSVVNGLSMHCHDTEEAKRIQGICAQFFPGERHRAVSATIRSQGSKNLYTFVVLDLSSGTCSVRDISNEIILKPMLYGIEIRGDGKIVKETSHPVVPPEQVLDAYNLWNPKGRHGQYLGGVPWYASTKNGKRVYSTDILIGQVEKYDAEFTEDGTRIRSVHDKEGTFYDLNSVP